jgi:hypothetical protein
VLLAMDDDCNVGSAEGLVLNNQVLSNLAFTLQDPLNVCCRKNPKSLRQKKKNPKENKEIKKTCENQLFFTKASKVFL